MVSCKDDNPGAGGGVGTVCLQLAKQYYAHVTGAESGAKLETMKSPGVDAVIDYKQIDFIDTGARYELILDTKTNRPPSAYLRPAKPLEAITLRWAV